MSITAEAPRGGLVEEINGVSRTFLLRNREIERFEDKHGGIFDLWDGFFRSGTKPTSKAIKDLLALGLVGGGLKDAEADKVLEECTPADLQRLFAIAQAVLGCAFMPDVGANTSKKKPDEDQAGSTSEG